MAKFVSRTGCDDSLINAILKSVHSSPVKSMQTSIKSGQFSLIKVCILPLLKMWILPLLNFHSSKMKQFGNQLYWITRPQYKLYNNDIFQASWQEKVSHVCAKLTRHKSRIQRAQESNRGRPRAQDRRERRLEFFARMEKCCTEVNALTYICHSWL